MTKYAAARLAAAVFMLPGALGAQPPALDTEALEDWLAAYETAWETKDADAAARLFTTDARYFETPYAEPFAGRQGIREYWSDVTANQRDIDFESDVVAVDGDVGVARWTASFVAGGADVELDGVFVLEFEGGELCSELREWWHMRPAGE